MRNATKNRETNKTQSSPDAEVERHLVASIITYGCIAQATDLGVKANHLSLSLHRDLFRACQELAADGTHINALTLRTKLAEHGISGIEPELMELYELKPDLHQLAFLITHTKKVSGKRLIASAARQVAQRELDPTAHPSELVELLQRASHEVLADTEVSSTTTLAQAVPGALDNMEFATNSGTPTWYPDLDRLLNGGVKQGHLIILAAATGMGKTSFALNLAVNIARQSKPVLFFSLEMGSGELAGRVIGMVADLRDPYTPTFTRSRADVARAREASQEIMKWPLHIDDRSASTVLDIATKIETIQRQHGQLGLVVIDYLQLISTPGHSENRAVAVAEISRALKITAQTLQVPLLALSQLSRDVAKRPGHIPQLSDLKESGSLENDSDIVMFVTRDDYYLDTSERDTADIPAKLIVAKHRQGPVGEIDLLYQPSCTRFDVAPSKYSASFRKDEPEDELF